MIGTGGRRFKWYGMAAVALLTAGAGLLVGKWKEKDYLGLLYERRDFTLLDEQGEFFSLSSLPQRKLALLVFTPDAIPLEAVRPFRDFGRHLEDLGAHGIETLLVSRAHREIVKNFKGAARFQARLLLDAGGTVARNAGVWEGIGFVPYWSYALVDREFRVLWSATSDAPMEYARLRAELGKAR